MSPKECERCGIEYQPKRSAQKYCTPKCGYDSKRKPRELWLPPPRPCAVCEQTFNPDASLQKYCSSRCRERAKYASLKANPERYAAYLARTRTRYTPKPPRPIRTCDQAECDGKHLARGMCRKHYRAWQWAQGAESPNPAIIIMGMASLHGALFPKLKPIKVRPAVGVMAHCPWCDSLMGATSPVDRACRSCGTTVVLNEEEVSWAISERRSTVQRSPISC